MEPLAQKILVVGGNGFIGSAVCKAAMARGIQVTSISSSGTPYKTPKGHTPAWVAKVEWRKADALIPETYSDILPKVGAVVHTLGTLLEDGKYKSALAHGELIGLIGAIAGGGGSPLDRGPQRCSYELINRDSALRVCQAFKSSKPDPGVTHVRPFIYISAEDIFRPLIPARYIETKREAEQTISQLLRDHPRHRSVFIRPSFVYHAHHRPLTSPLAALIDLSASIHASVPKDLPTPSSLLRAAAHAFPSSHASPLPSPLHSIANALSVPPIHVEHVAEAICIALDPTKDVRGVVGVNEMRELIGWSQKSQAPRLERA
ncbi:NAD(P)-binding protein [Imleria badia]|nr:NAD(P)-binding protein [Imleria badia]